MPGLLSIDRSGSLRPARDDTCALLELAAAIVASGNGEDSPERSRVVEEFLRRYSLWILAERGMLDDKDAWVERHSILMHLMVSGSTIGEALAIFVRFAKSVWVSGTSFGLRRLNNGSACLTIDELCPPGPEGTISTLWLLSSIFIELEFLAGHALEPPAARVRGQRCVPPDLERFFYGGVVDYDQERTELIIPAKLLQLAVAASSADITPFLRSFMQLSITANKSYDIYRGVYGILWRDATRTTWRDSDMDAVAGRLGMSKATLRRRLQQEGFTFKQIRTDVFDRLSKAWLVDPDFTIEQIVEKFDYSDTFSFRRAFRTLNGMAPLSYRKAALQAGSRQA